MDYYEKTPIHTHSSHSSTDSITSNGNNHRHKYSYRSSIIDGSRLYTEGTHLTFTRRVYDKKTNTIPNHWISAA